MLKQATVIFLLSYLIGCQAIDCYQCESISHNNLECEDPFNIYDLNRTFHYLHRGCHSGLFAGKYCVKLSGHRGSGESVFYRRCAIEPWGSQCGGIMLNGEMIKGCVASCNHDGCNAAARRSVTWTSVNLFFIFVLIHRVI